MPVCVSNPYVSNPSNLVVLFQIRGNICSPQKQRQKKYGQEGSGTVNGFSFHYMLDDQDTESWPFQEDSETDTEARMISGCFEILLCVWPLVQGLDLRPFRPIEGVRVLRNPSDKTMVHQASE